MSFQPPRRPYPELENELRKVAVEPKTSLRTRYIGLFGYAPPKAFGPDLLRRSVAQRMQENAYGGLSKSMQRELDRLVAAMIAKPGERVLVKRRAQSGAVLVRDRKGKSHRVMILDDGFGYDGRSFASLSEIARLITGTRWNGPRFFGLRRQRPEGVAAPADASKRLDLKARSQNTQLRSSTNRMRAGHGL